MTSLIPLTTGQTTLLQSYAILAAALAAGTNLSTSIITIPALLRSPHALLVEQFSILYYRGIGPQITLCQTSAISFAVLAYSAHHTPLTPSSLTKLYAVAAVAAFSMAPYTQILMGATNKTLLGLEVERIENGGKGEVRAGEAPPDRLVETWGALNFVRGLLPLTAAVVGLWASLK